MYGRIYSDSSSTRRHYSVFSALSAFCLGNGDVCTMHTPELHDNIENKSFILTNEVRFFRSIEIDKVWRFWHWFSMIFILFLFHEASKTFTARVWSSLYPTSRVEEYWGILQFANSVSISTTGKGIFVEFSTLILIKNSYLDDFVHSRLQPSAFAPCVE